MKKLNLFTEKALPEFNPMVEYTFENVTGRKLLHEVISDLKMNEMNNRHIPYRVSLTLLFDEPYRYKYIKFAVTHINGNYQIKRQETMDRDGILEKYAPFPDKLAETKAPLAEMLNVFVSMEEDVAATFDVLNRVNTHQGISSALFESMVPTAKDYTFMYSDEVQTYKSIIWGKRAPKGFWSNMTDEAYMNILKYHALFIANIDTIDKAKRLNMADLVDFKVPNKTRSERNFKIFSMVTLLYPELRPWQMHFLPRHSSNSNTVKLAIALTALQQYDVNLITTSDLKRVAPCMYKIFGSLKAFKSYVKEMELK